MMSLRGKAILILGLACVHTAAPSIPEPENALVVYPESITLTRPHETARILVSQPADNGRLIDVTKDAVWAIDNDRVAAVSAHGLVRALHPGTATVQVRAGSFTAQARVRVDFSPAEPNPGVSFLRDVLPILSRAGCNNGSCHAKPQGQNGFKLSVFAYDPASDYRNILVEGRGRRVFPAAPESSLLLQKPTLGVPHEGGRRFEIDSEFYETIRQWIAQGMPYQHPLEPHLDRIDVYPAERSYAPNQSQPLLVRAHYDDGTVRDVTGLAEFQSTDDEVVEVDEEGRLTVLPRTGQAVVLARFLGHVAMSQVTAPAKHLLADEVYAALPRHNFIDEHAYAHFRKLGLRPSDTCTDGEFIRRAYLDATGTLPPADEVAAFLEDESPDKRNQLVDRILSRPAYADHWAVKWGDLLRPNPFRVGVKSVYVMDQWLRQSFRENKPLDQFVGELLTAQGSTHAYGPAVFFRDHREPEDRSTVVSRLFLGTRLECARCHHHPNEKWSQKDFYQFAAFFGQLKRKGTGLSPPISGSREIFYHAPGGSVKHPVTGEVMEPAALDGAPADIPNQSDPRIALAAWMTGTNNSMFAQAAVNRVWGEFFGRGIVEPVDDFRASNPPAIAPLLEALAEDFVAHGFDMKHLMRTIMRSRLYQLSSVPNSTNLQDTKYFSRAYRRRLPAEVLLDAVSRITGTTERFDGLPPDSRALASWNNRLDSDFMDAFGRPDPSADCPCDRNREPSVVQALHLMHSDELQKRLDHKQGWIQALLAEEPSNEEIVRALYLGAYARNPTEEEWQITRAAYASEGADRQTVTEDILWALINSAEFVLNH